MTISVMTTCVTFHISDDCISDVSASQVRTDLVLLLILGGNDYIPGVKSPTTRPPAVPASNALSPPNPR